MINDEELTECPKCGGELVIDLLGVKETNDDNDEK